MQSRIFPENTASLSLHQRAGFRVIGTRERMGRHDRAWRDVVLAPEHLLLALIDSEQPDPVAELMAQLNIDRAVVRERVRRAGT